MANEKVQLQHPYGYLGYTLYPRHFMPHWIKIRMADCRTLNDFQKLLGDINWIRPTLGLTTGELKPLFDILKGDSDPTSPRQLTEEARQSLQKVE